MITACLNGARLRGAHPRLPVTAEELGVDAAAAVASGAGMLHVHPRNALGRESLSAADVVAAVAAIRGHAPGVRVSVTTRDGIVTDHLAKLRALREWPEPAEGGPDCASVNWHEPGAVEVARVLRARGVGVEAGIWTPRAATAFVSTPWPWQVERVLVEAIPGSSPGSNARWSVERILAALGMSPQPLLVHGEQGWTWPVLRWAQAAGHHVRIGFEDTLVLPTGQEAYDNAELVAAALGGDARSHAHR
ncbi:MAG TPA: 3-keto-5-aminohexanoate cleavage protein [Intrasporangium sp.]|uniref:3-keto-5-aminohexanoate cleavage protein n=1 Tax=Intrasporangium sp. TaxID=1925024 RepID=UPI002D773585|nr:3-keto-5-aminohexanoate cleavage protein [Intrasporangium sp.]HET7398870.1 3-keto-5-aminohexanoate cleavage protein [Intrasporangium sp.]